MCLYVTFIGDFCYMKQSEFNKNTLNLRSYQKETSVLKPIIQPIGLRLSN